MLIKKKPAVFSTFVNFILIYFIILNILIPPFSFIQVAEAIIARYDFSSEKMTRFLIQKWLKTSDRDDAALAEATKGGGNKAVKKPTGLSLADIFSDEPKMAVGGGLAAVADLDLNLLRAIYLLKTEPLQAAVSYLLDFVYLEEVRLLLSYPPHDLLIW